MGFNGNFMVINGLSWDYLLIFNGDLMVIESRFKGDLMGFHGDSKGLNEFRMEFY